MAVKPNVSIPISLDERPTVAALKRLATEFGRFSVGANQSLELLGKAWSGVTGLITGSIDAVKEYVELASIQERAERKLLASISGTQAEREAALQTLQEFNSAIQQRLGFGDEELLQLQSTLAAMGVTNSALADATKGTLALATILGGDLNDKSKAVAKALRGDVGALKEYGIQAKDAADAQRQLNELFAIAEAQSGTLETRIKVLNANFGDFKEVVGQAFTASGALKEGISALSAFTVDLINLFSGPEGQRVVNEFFSVLASGVAGAVDGVVGLLRLYQDYKEILTEVTAAERASFEARVQPFEQLANRLNAAATQGITPVSGRGLFTPTETDDTKKTGGGRKSLEDRYPLLKPGAPQTLASQLIAANQAVLDAENASLEAGRAQERARQESELAGIQHFENAKTQIAVQKAEERDALLQQQRESELQTALTFAQVGANALAQTITAAVSGQLGEADAARKLLGGIVTSIGQALIGLGSAAIAAGVMGTAAPWLAAHTGGSAAVGAGVAAIAAGGVIAGIGARLGGGGATSAGAAPAAGSPGAAVRPASAGFAPGASQPQMGQTIVVNLNGPVGGTPRRVARDLQALLASGQTLNPAGT